MNIQPQIGNGKRMLSFAHVNVIEQKKVEKGKEVGAALIKQALTLSMGDSTTRWIVEQGGTYVITTKDPRTWRT